MEDRWSPSLGAALLMFWEDDQLRSGMDDPWFESEEADDFRGRATMVQRMTEMV
jgi:hypothetical protein